MPDNDEFKEIINKIQDYVETHKHAYIIPEHAFLVLLNDKKCVTMIEELTTDEDKSKTVASLKKNVEEYIQNNMEEAKAINDITPTTAYTKVMQSALSTAAMRQDSPNSLNVFVSLFTDENSAVKCFLFEHGITEQGVIDYICNHRANHKVKGTGALTQYAVSLNQVASEGKIDPLIGRQKEIDRIVQILAKKKSNNPIIVGTAGCVTGDTEILVRKVNSKPTPVKMIFD